VVINDELDNDDNVMPCFIAIGICEKFAKVMSQYGIMCTRVPVELDLSSCSWLTADEQNFYSAVVKDCEHAKEVFLHYSLRYNAINLLLFKCASKNLYVTHP